MNNEGMSRPRPLEQVVEDEDSEAKQQDEDDDGDGGATHVDDLRPGDLLHLDHHRPIERRDADEPQPPPCAPSPEAACSRWPLLRFLMELMLVAARAILLPLDALRVERLFFMVK